MFLELISFGVVFVIISFGFLSIIVYVWYEVKLFYKELKSKYVLTLDAIIEKENNEIEGISMNMVNNEEEEED